MAIREGQGGRSSRPLGLDRRSSDGRTVAGSAWGVSPSDRTPVEMQKNRQRRGSPVDVMLVSNIPKEPYLAFRHKHSHTQSVYRCISKSLVVEAPSSIQPVKISFVRFSAEEIQVPNLKVREELAIVVVSTIVGVKQPVQIGIRVYQLWMGVDERAGAGPEGRKGSSVVEDVHVETVLHAVIAHEAEDVVVNVAEEVDLAPGMSV